MNKFLKIKPNCFLAAITVVSLQMICSGVANSQVSNATIDLTNFLESENLKNSDIHHASTVLKPKVGTWAKGMAGTVNQKWFSLKPKSNDDGSIGSSLKIQFIGASVDGVKECSPFDGCRDVGFTKVAQLVTFQVEGMSWELKLYGAPCIGANTCELSVSSWALTQLASHGRSLSQFPQVTTVIHHKNGLTFFDANSSRIWLDLPNSEVGIFAALGNLANATMTNDVMILSFASGHLFLDLLKDRVVLANKNGVSLFERGVGNFNKGAPISLQKKTKGATSSEIIFVSEKAIVWEDSFVNLNFSADDQYHIASEYFELPDSMIAANVSYDGKTPKVITVSREGKALNLWAYDSDSQGFAKYSTLNASSKISDDSVYFSKSDLFRNDKLGLYYLDHSGDRPTSLSTSYKEIKFLRNGNAFLQMISESDCRWIHYKQHDKVPTSFKESGLVSHCGLTNDAAVLEGAATLTVYDGRKIEIGIIRQ